MTKILSFRRKLPLIFRNFLLSIIVLTPVLTYLGTSYFVQLESPINKTGYVHWNGLDPKSEVYVTWETESLTETYIRYGTDESSLNQIIQNDTLTKMHRVKISGLSADTQYYYKIDRTQTNIHGIQTFKTAAETYIPFNITIISDTQQMWGTGHYNTIADSISRISDTSFVVDVGDVGQEPDDQETWNYFFEQSAKYSSRFPFVPILGNHDGHVYENNLYTKYFGISNGVDGSYYSFNWSNTQFVMAEIASTGDRDMDIQRNIDHDIWLNATLAAGQDKDFRILMFHRQVFSSLGNDAAIMDRIIPIVRDYNVSLVLYGHVHMYERFYYENTTYICLGGGGGLQNVYAHPYSFTQKMAMGASYTQLFFNNNSIKLVTYAPNTDIIDEVTLVKEGNQMVPNIITSNGGF